LPSTSTSVYPLVFCFQIHIFCLPLGLLFPNSYLLSTPWSFVSKFIYNTLLGILFSSILCKCPYQRTLCSHIVCVTVGLSYRGKKTGSMEQCPSQTKSPLSTL
jgi:hypothetical protein